MKKKILSIFVLTMVVSLGLGTLVSAESSKANLSFTEDNSSTNPVNPENPDLPGEGGGTGAPGPLSIDYVPSLPFGTQKITGKIETYKTSNKKPYIQVTDKRGTGAGYTIKANLSEFVSLDDPTKSLAGAKIDFKDADVATTSTNSSAAPTPNKSIALQAGGEPVQILKADSDKGMGTWVQRWLSANDDNEKVELTVNTNNAYKAAYEGTITWSVEVAP